MHRVTLTQYLIEQQRDHGRVSPELRLLIEIIARACKAISHAVSGMNTLLASPPRKVSVMIARRKSCG